MVCLYCETAASEIQGIITHSLALHGPDSDTFGTFNLKLYARNTCLYIYKTILEKLDLVLLCCFLLLFIFLHCLLLTDDLCVKSKQDF